MKRLLLIAAILLASSRAEAAIVLLGSGGGSIASRTSCTAPCAVFFDVIGSTGMAGTTTQLPNGDYVRAHVKWDFADAGSTHPTEIGFQAGHVFESTGTYVVAVSMTDTSGATGSTTVSITVTAMAGTTYYCSAAGSGSTCSFASPCDLTTCKTHVATGNTMLFRQGDGWTNVTKWQFSVTGPVLFGSYYQGSGSTAAPSISFVSTETNPVQLDTATDVRFVGLHFTDTSNGGTVLTIGQTGTTTHTLVLRTEVQANVTGIYFSKNTDNSFVVDSNIHGQSQYGLYGAGPERVALLGNTVTDYGIYHGTRIQGCQETGTPGSCSDGSRPANRTLINHSVYSNSGTPFDSVQFRGDHTNVTYVGNVADNNVGFQPQNDTFLEVESLGLFEGNLFYGPTAGTTARGAFIFKAKHVEFRNNVCSGGVTCVTVAFTNGATGYPANWVDEVFVENNSGYFPPVLNGSGQSEHPRMCDNQAAGTSLLVCKNNIFFNAAASSIYGTSGVTSGSGWTEDYNLWWAPNGANFTAPGGTHDVNANPGFATTPVTAAAHVAIGSSSPAKDVGTSLPVYADFAGATRPQNSLFDMGAFEYVPSVTYTAGKGALSTFGGF